MSVGGENKLPPILTVHSLVTSPDATGLIPKINRECLRLHYTFLASFTKQVLGGYMYTRAHTHTQQGFIHDFKWGGGGGGGGGGGHLTPYFKDTRVTRESGGMIIPNMRFLHSLKLILMPFWSEISFFFSHFVWC